MNKPKKVEIDTMSDTIFVDGVQILGITLFHDNVGDRWMIDDGTPFWNYDKDTYDAITKHLETME